MTHTYNVILLTGPKAAGKSYFANEFVKYYDALNLVNDARALPVIRESIISPIHHMFFAFCEAAAGDTIERTFENYQRLKESVILGRQGREWICDIGDGIRKNDQGILVRMLIERIESRQPQGGKQGVVVIDDLGFPLEHAMLTSHSNFRCTTIYLGERVDPEHKFVHGEQFPGDIRFCMRDIADFIDIPPRTIIVPARFPDLWLPFSPKSPN